MTKDEIKKALECCSSDVESCAKCPYDFACTRYLCKDALNLIAEQEKEIKNQRQIIENLNKAKERLDSAPNGWAYTTYIDELIEEVENDK